MGEPEFHWTLPTQAWGLRDAGLCQLDVPGYDVDRGQVDVVVTPGGTLEVECVFRPPVGA